MPQRPRIKVCGIKTPDIAEAAVDAGADMVGVNFVERSPRCVTIDQAAAISQGVAGRAEVVGLFLDGEPDAMRRAAGQANLSMLQLHGRVDAALLRELEPIRVMVSLPFDAHAEAALLRWNEDPPPNLAALLVDTPDPSKIGGGTGVAFDWHALRESLDRVRPNLPIILAGGLTPDNVAEAIAAVRPWMVDVSSGVESTRGVKDAGLVRAFCRAVFAGNRQ